MVHSQKGHFQPLQCEDRRYFCRWVMDLNGPLSQKLSLTLSHRSDGTQSKWQTVLVGSAEWRGLHCADQHESVSKSHTVTHTDTLSALREGWQNHPIARPNLKNQTRSRFIQLKLTTAVKSKMILSFQYGCQRKTASPWGPCWRNRVFRRPLSGCQDSGCPPIYPRPCEMNSSQADVRWGDEGCDTARLNALREMIVLPTDCCILSITCLSTQWRVNLNSLFFRFLLALYHT